MNETTYLVHHGIKGQRWGVRRYQRDDGSLTRAGRIREVKQQQSAQLDAAGYTKKIGKRGVRVKSVKFGSKAHGQMIKDKLSGKYSKPVRALNFAKKTNNIRKTQNAQRRANRKMSKKHMSTGSKVAMGLLAYTGAMLVADTISARKQGKIAAIDMMKIIVTKGNIR